MNEFVSPNVEFNKRRGGGPGEDAAARAFLARQLVGEDWQSAQQFQCGELARMIDYLRSQRVRVGAVLLPFMTWNDRQPYAAAFAQHVEEICRDAQVEVLDLSRAAPDDEFYDDTHVSNRGQVQIDAMIRDFVLKTAQ